MDRTHLIVTALCVTVMTAVPARAEIRQGTCTLVDDVLAFDAVQEHAGRPASVRAQLAAKLVQAAPALGLTDAEIEAWVRYFMGTVPRSYDPPRARLRQVAAVCASTESSDSARGQRVMTQTDQTLVAPQDRVFEASAAAAAQIEHPPPKMSVARMLLGTVGFVGILFGGAKYGLSLEKARLRRAMRHDCRLPVILTRRSERLRSVVVNYSMGGCMIAQPVDPARAGDRVTVTTSVFSRKAKVVWARQHFFGVRFARGLDAAAIRRVRSADASAPGPLPG